MADPDQATEQSGPLTMDQAAQAWAKANPDNLTTDELEAQQDEQLSDDVTDDVTDDETDDTNEFEEESDDQEITDDEDESEDETEDEESEQETDDEEQEDESEEEVQLSTLEDLSQQLDVDLNNLETTVKLNGEEVTVTLGELAQGYQREDDYRRKTQGLADDKRKFDEKVAEGNGVQQQRYDQTANLLTLVQKQLVDSLETPEMQTLKVNDPDEYARRGFKIKQQQETFDALIAQAVQMQQENTQQMQQQAMEQGRKFLDDQIATAKNTEYWQTWEKENPEQDFIESHKKFLTDEGWPPELIQHLGHELHFKVVHDAMKYKQLMAQQKQAVSKVKNSPKKAIRGKTGKKVTASQRKINQLRKQFNAKPTVENAAKLRAAQNRD